MAIFPGSAIPSGVSAYTIDYSCRFDAVRNTYLSDTPGSDGSKRKFTVSAWVKLGGTDTSVGMSGRLFRSILLRGYDGDDNNTTIQMWTTLDFFSRVSNSVTNYGNIRTEAKLRDYSSWYHVVVAIDTEQAASGDRCKQYINGVLQTDFSANTIIAEDQDIPYWAITSMSRDIGRHLEGEGGTAGQSFDNAYVAEYYYIDGAQVAASVFGETNEDTNQWVPIDNSDVQDAVTFGTCGFYLDFADSSDLGKDVSGQGNHFTSSGFTANDQMIDTPTNNFATMNPIASIAASNASVFSEGNLKIVFDSSGQQLAPGTIGVSSGKWYWEGYVVSKSGDTQYFGVVNSSSPVDVNIENINPACSYMSDGQKKLNGSSSSYGDSYTTDDIIGLALNLDDNEVTFYKNDTAQDSGTAISITADTYVSVIGRGGSTSTWVYNFGSDSSFAGNKTAQGNQDSNGKGDFYYTPPTDYLALCTDNLPDPEIALPTDHFETIIWTGDGTSGAMSTTGLSFQPDFFFQGCRAGGGGGAHLTYDAVRGFGDDKEITTNSTYAQGGENADEYGYVSGVTSDGVTYAQGSLGVGSGIVYYNTTDAKYVLWNWKAGGTAVSNTDGTITSSVSANPTAGFSIASYTGTGSAATIGHGLSEAPTYIMVKNLTDTYNWFYGGPSFTNGWSDWMHWNKTDEQGNNSADAWNSTAPTASVFSVGSAYNSISSKDYIAYCFHSVEGYSKVGSYEGNGDLDGAFVYTGFRPAFVMTKSIDSSSDWQMFDNKRVGYNVDNYELEANDSAAEDTSTEFIDIVSNGFKNRDTTDPNVAETYIYIAFAESPFKYSNAR